VGTVLTADCILNVQVPPECQAGTDTVAPTFTFVPPDLTISVCKNADIGRAEAIDTCGVFITNDAPTVFPLGTTVVTWSAVDAAGNIATATQRVTAILGDDPSCCPSGTNIIIGTQGHDVLHGTAGSDCILGLGGDDVIDSGAGDDFVSGGAGRDTIVTGAGNDVVFGGDDDDKINGGQGNDRINGGPGRDECVGGTGSNVLEQCEL